MKKKLLFIFILIIFILTGITGSTYFFLSRSHKKETPSLPAQIPPKARTETTLFFSPQTRGVPLGKTFSPEIRISSRNLSLSAIALRFSYRFDQKAQLLPQNLKMKANPQLIEKGGLYAINKIEVDQENQTVFGDLAITIPTIGGFRLDEELVLATLDFLAQNPIQNLVFEFDPVQTKAFTKEGREISFNLERAVYSINPKL